MRPLLLLLLLLPLSAWACKCADSPDRHSFAERVDSARLLVSGRVVVSREVPTTAQDPTWYGGTKMQFKLLPTRLWKGAPLDTLVVTSSRSSCGVELQPGQEYVFFFADYPGFNPKALDVGRCSDYAGVDWSADLGLLKARFDPAFRRQLGQTPDARLNAAEAEYFAGTLPVIPGITPAFAFADKQVALVVNEQRLDKPSYFQRYALQQLRPQLLVLTPAEKAASGGYDALVLAPRRWHLRPSYRRQLVRRLARAARPSSR